MKFLTVKSSTSVRKRVHPAGPRERKRVWTMNLWKTGGAAGREGPEPTNQIGIRISLVGFVDEILGRRETF